MISLVDFLFEVERRKDELAQAQHYRLARQVARHNPATRRTYRRLLARLGKLLIAWGCQLQTRFATEAEMR
jgi:hypothetical protein